MAPRVGFEPTTSRLTADCSTTELPRNRAASLAYPLLSGYSKAHQFQSERFPVGASLRKMKKGPGFGPAPRRWVMVGCLQGKTMRTCHAKVNKRLTTTTIFSDVATHPLH